MNSVQEPAGAIICSTQFEEDLLTRFGGAGRGRRLCVRAGSERLRTSPTGPAFRLSNLVLFYGHLSVRFRVSCPHVLADVSVTEPSSSIFPEDQTAGFFLKKTLLDIVTYY